MFTTSANETSRKPVPSMMALLSAVPSEVHEIDTACAEPKAKTAQAAKANKRFMCVCISFPARVSHAMGGTDGKPSLGIDVGALERALQKMSREGEACTLAPLDGSFCGKVPSFDVRSVLRDCKTLSRRLTRRVRGRIT